MSLDSDHRAIRRLGLDRLCPHEQTMPDHVNTLARRIEADGKLELPILVDAETNVILDGHHRRAALRKLGARQVTAIAIDYLHEDELELASGPNCPVEELTRDTVLETGLSESILPPKSTRHRVLFPYPTVNTPLEQLTETDPPDD